MFLFFVSLLLSPLFVKATVITVNADSNFAAEYTSLTDAIAAASAGDTIYIHGSSSSYGNQSIDKQLYIYGPGYLLNDNPVPAQQTAVEDATLGTTTIQPTASGTLVQGIRFSFTLNIHADNVTIENCRTSNIEIGDNSPVTAVNNISIRKNYCGQITINYGSSNVIVANNIAFGTVRTQSIS